MVLNLRLGHRLLRKLRLRTFCPCSRCVARTIDVRGLFHGLALGAAVFTRRCHARTNGVCALLTFCSRHFFSPGFGSTTASDPDAILGSWDRDVCPIRDTFARTGIGSFASFGTASVAPACLNCARVDQMGEGTFDIFAGAPEEHGLWWNKISLLAAGPPAMAASASCVSTTR